MRPEEAVTIIAAVLVFALLAGLLAWGRWLRYRELLGLAERGIAPPEPRAGHRTLRWGILLAAVGLATSIGLYPLTRSSFPNLMWGLGPPMLLGLVPLFVGLGLVLLWVVDRRPEPESDELPWTSASPEARAADLEAARKAAMARLDRDDERGADPGDTENDGASVAAQENTQQPASPRGQEY